MLDEIGLALALVPLEKHVAAPSLGLRISEYVQDVHTILREQKSQ
jgi:hypothetical protein